MPALRLQLHSLKLRLLLPYAILIVLLTAIIVTVTYVAGVRIITSLSDRMLQEMAARIQQSIRFHVHGSAAVLEATFPVGMTAEPDIRRQLLPLRSRLWAATTLHPYTNDYVYYGNLAGQNIAIKRLPDGTAELRLRTHDGEYRKYYALDSINGEPRYLFTEKTMFEPRQRPWFKLAANVDDHTWTSVYIDFSIKDLVMTRARRVLDVQGEFQGVVATDVSLKALNRVVDELGRSVQGRAFIIEPGGEIVAASGMDNVFHAADGRLDRMTIGNAQDPLIRTIYEQIQPHFQQRAKSVTTQTIHRVGHHIAQSLHLTDMNGKPLHAAFVRVHDDAGLDWMAVVAVPRATLLADMNSLLFQVAAAGGICLVLALLIGVRLFGRVADDIIALSQAVQRVGQGDIAAPITTDRTDEVGDLARNVGQMRQELFTDRLTGAANRSALQHILNTMTAKSGTDLAGQAVMAPAFALLFIDLNLFKPLNDRWGHDNGDRALAEVVQRLRTHTRGGDHVARLGGDEFVVVLNGVDSLAAAQVISDKLKQHISAPLTTLQGVPDGEIVHLGACIGIALYPHDAKDAQQLLKHADQQMYAQKAKRPATQQR